MTDLWGESVLRHFIVLAVCAASLTGANAAIAQPGPRANSIETGFALGVLVPSSEHELYAPPAPFRELSPGPMLSWRAAYLATRMLAFEVEVDAVRLAGDGDAVATIVAPRAHLLLQLPRRLTPFAVAGVGVLSSSSEQLGDDADPMAYAGLGAKFYWTDRTSLRADARLLRSSRAEATDAGKGTNHFQVSVGIGWTFGRGATPSPPPVDSGPRDSDGDGLMDAQDACPHDAETVNGVRDDDGCPEAPEVAALPPLPVPAAPTNADGDIVTGDDDLCPDVAEDVDGFEDTDGCPEPDNDRDGIPDASDKCPNEAETPNGIDDDDGCPDAGPPTVVLAAEIRFESNEHTLDVPSKIVLDRVAGLLLANPRITKVRVGGHSDNEGTPVKNILLSSRRANRVKDYLVSLGIDESRIDTHGYGPAHPIADNTTAAGRALNRRVEIRIDEIDGRPAEPQPEATP